MFCSFNPGRLRMVKVIAEYERGANSFTAQGRLVVTVPDFIQRLK